MKLFRALALAVAVSVLALPAAGDPGAQEIADKLLDSSAFDWSGAKTKMKMVVIGADGKKSTRVLEVLARRVDGRVQTVVRFLSPPDVAGTAFLMLERDGGKSEQHIYLPGLRRTRRISGREREGSFVGTEFNYQDLRRADSRDADHERLDDSDVGGEPVFVVRSVPKGKKATYSKIETWVRKSDFVPLRTRFFDKKGELQKTLYARKVKQLDDRPVVVEARMENHKTGAATELHVESIERRDNLPDSAFTPTALEHQ